MAEIFFEKYNIPAIHIAPQAPLALFSLNLETGIVLDCGDGLTNIVPVYHGFTVKEAVISHPFGGIDLSDFLTSMVKKRIPSLSIARDISYDIKEFHFHLLSSLPSEFKS